MSVDMNLLETGMLLVPTNPDEQPRYYIQVDDNNSCSIPIINLLTDFITYDVPTLWLFHEDDSSTLHIASQKEQFGDQEPMGYITRKELLNLTIGLLKSANWKEEKLNKTIGMRQIK